MTVTLLGLTYSITGVKSSLRVSLKPRAEAVGRKSFTVLTRRDVIEGINLDAVRLYKIRLTNSDEEDIDEEAERRTAAVLDLLRLIV